MRTITCLFHTSLLCLVFPHEPILVDASLRKHSSHGNLERHTHGGYHNVGIRKKRRKGDKRSKSSKKSKSKSPKSLKRPKKALTCSDNIQLSEKECSSRIQVKRGIFGGLQFAKTVRFASRVETQTIVSYETANVLWYAWEVSDDQLDTLRDELPSGLTLTEISISEGESSKYYIVLNLYNVLIDGRPAIRAEWSTFVQNQEESTPYLLILDAPTNIPGHEPTQCLPKDPASLFYEVRNTTVGAVLEAKGGSLFSNFTMLSMDTETEAHHHFNVDMTFQVANKKSYWLSGVYDKRFYSSSPVTTSTPIRVPISTPDFKLVDDTYWSRLYKSSIPDHAFYYAGTIDFALNPWYNLDDLENISGELYTCLDTFKFNHGSGFASQAFSNAIGVSDGTVEALLNYNWQGSESRPTTYLNFEINEKNNVRKLEHMLPGNLKLVKTKMRNDSEERYTMTIRINEGGIESSMYQGLHISIIIYVMSTTTQETYQMVLQTKSNVDSFQADRLFVPPTSSFIYSQDNSIVEVNVKDDELSFAASIPINANSETGALDLTWLASHDRQYAINGIYDYFMCDDSLYSMEAISIDTKDVDISSMESEWFVFIHGEPYDGMIVQEKVGCIDRPWYNLVGTSIGSKE